MPNEKLANLPKSDDQDFWLDAEINTNIPGLLKQFETDKLVEEQRKNHYFVRTTGRQAQCQHCDWGFELEPGDLIKEGHLYDKKGNLVI